MTTPCFAAARFAPLAASICIALLALPPGTAGAATAEEAAKLKTELTPMGGERAGNKDGSIPAWSGGYTTPPAGYKSGQRRPDPFAEDKPLLTITAANMAQYAARLDEGQQHLLKTQPDYKMVVYPTRRSAAAPEWTYAETFKNATRAKLEDYSVVGAYGGIPFPIPKSGLEVMWNHALRIQPPAYRFVLENWVVDSSGTPSLSIGQEVLQASVYYEKGGSPESMKGKPYYSAVALASAPPVRAGEANVVHDYMDSTRQVWQYLVGQRRVRRAPLFCCDTPNATTSGVAFVDEVYTFWGPMDRYEWKVIGKKEMYIPYNMNGYALKPVKEVLGKGTLNPNVVRWELHRVWEVEATLRAGQRDVRSRRKIYVDEDSWIAVLATTWDGQGAIWHHSMGFPYMLYELPSMALNSFAIIDFVKKNYVVTTFNDATPHLEIVPMPPEAVFTQEGLINRAVR